MSSSLGTINKMLRPLLAAALMLAVASGQAHADSLLFDFSVVLPKTRLSPLLSKLSFVDNRALAAAEEEERLAEIFGREPAALPDASRFDDMVGHRFRWHYDGDWSSSLGSDFPLARKPSYLIGNGAPGVTQKIWFQFSISRRF